VLVSIAGKTKREGFNCSAVPLRWNQGGTCGLSLREHGVCMMGSLKKSKTLTSTSAGSVQNMVVIIA